ncbi:myb/SANT-like DNA-binding domain-containing protein 3 isoform X2 [Linepithema humile]
MEESVKEGRSVNFTASEIITLIELVKKYQHIIECKKTDSTTWRDKDECWSKITDELNSCCGETYRKKKSVKTKYEDMKKNLKKKLSRNKMETFKTGGGPANIQPLTFAEEILLSFLPSTIQGLPSVFDSDRILADKQMSKRKTSLAETVVIKDNINDESQTQDTDDQFEWIYETLNVDEVNDEDKTENAAYFSDVEDDTKYTNKKRLPLEDVFNTHSSAHVKKIKTYDIDDNNIKSVLDLKNVKKYVSRTTSNSTEKCTKSAKTGVDILRKKVSKELKTENGNASKSIIKTDIINLANAKEELVQLQKTALETDIQIKERNNNTQEEILQIELEISKEKLKFVKLEIQLKELEVEIKKQQLTRLL